MKLAGSRLHSDGGADFQSACLSFTCKKLEPLLTYVIKLSDQALIVPIHGVSAVWGLIAAGLFANGWYGRGWNGVGVEEYLGVSGQGVTGILTPVGIQPDFPQQLYAQLIGLAAIGLFAFVISWVVFKLLSAFTAVREEIV